MTVVIGSPEGLELAGDGHSTSTISGPSECLKRASRSDQSGSTSASSGVLTDGSIASLEG